MKLCNTYPDLKKKAIIVIVFPFHTNYLNMLLMLL
jgi:hypothetical protein